MGAENPFFTHVFACECILCVLHTLPIVSGCDPWGMQSWLKSTPRGADWGAAVGQAASRSAAQNPSPYRAPTPHSLCPPPSARADLEDLPAVHQPGVHPPGDRHPLLAPLPPARALPGPSGPPLPLWEPPAAPSPSLSSHLWEWCPPVGGGEVIERPIGRRATADDTGLQSQPGGSFRRRRCGPVAPLCGERPFCGQGDVQGRPARDLSAPPLPPVRWRTSLSTWSRRAAGSR